MLTLVYEIRTIEIFATTTTATAAAAAAAADDDVDDDSNNNNNNTFRVRFTRGKKVHNIIQNTNTRSHSIPPVPLPHLSLCVLLCVTYSHEVKSVVTCNDCSFHPCKMTVSVSGYT